MPQIPPALPHGRHFDRTLIILCVRWCITYKLSYRDLVERDHRRVKRRVYPVLGSKSFANAAVTISGIEFVRQLGKGRFDTSAVIVSEGTRVSSVWEAVLSV